MIPLLCALASAQEPDVFEPRPLVADVAGILVDEATFAEYLTLRNDAEHATAQLDAAAWRLTREQEICTEERTRLVALQEGLLSDVRAAYAAQGAPTWWERHDGALGFVAGGLVVGAVGVGVVAAYGHAFSGSVR